MNPLPKAYEPAQVEDRLYAEWTAKNYFKADPDKVKADRSNAYSIVIPPPNITGVLTMGHVLNNTIQDILIRKARMEGKEVLWLPGTDHAGLATQTAVEKYLRKEEKKTRHDLGREEFLRRVREWQDKHGGIILQQLKKLGCSCDWSRLRYTMDDDYSRAVLEAFVKLYHTKDENGEPLIKRGLRMVNWCPGSLTAISDEEVIPKKQKGHLWTIRYEIVGQPGRFLEVATVRPETIMGDMAVAVNPQSRYKDLIGKKVRRPFPEGEIPVIADDLVDAKFGTGALKITPAHDKVDFEIGQRHNLPAVDVLTPNGKINCPAVPELHGLDRFDARKKAVELLKEKGLLAKEEPYENAVGFSERADVPIEPRLSEQWFMRYPKVKEARDVVKDGLIKFYPKHWEKVYDHWLENIQDWCISRQVWWGHRIPVWYKMFEKPKCQVESPGAGWEQDPDTLDTWASSWLWAYETMRTDDHTREKFYPTDVLVTGPDIIFLWVARMIIAGLEFEPSGEKENDKKNIPFEHVYFTGIIRDKQGRKMSKSLGNSPDPLDLIAKYGADGLRFGLMRIAPQGQDIRFDEKQIEEGRNFCNKLWNACRFREMQNEPIDPQADPAKAEHKLTYLAEHVLFEFHTVLNDYTNALNAYEFSLAANCIYSFFWNQFCARFLEVAKVDFQNSYDTQKGTFATFDYILKQVLLMLHPFAPFITEELWNNLKFGSKTIQFEKWPPWSLNLDLGRLKASHAEGEKFYNSVDRLASMLSELGAQTTESIDALQLAFVPTSTWTYSTWVQVPWQNDVLKTLFRAQNLEISENADPNKVPILTEIGTFYYKIADIAKEKARLEKELFKAASDLELTNKKLNDTNMVAKAPAEKVAEWKELAVALREKQKRLTEQLNSLK